MLRYFASMKRKIIILWCYFIWYLTTVFFHFDTSISIWINSIGISFVIGFALLLSVSGSSKWSDHKWQTFRLFLMPFCVSSFSSLIKGKGFILIFPSDVFELVVSISNCLLFLSILFSIKFFSKEKV